MHAKEITFAFNFMVYNDKIICDITRKMLLTALRSAADLGVIFTFNR